MSSEWISSISVCVREPKLLGPWINSSLENIVITFISSWFNHWDNQLVYPPGCSMLHSRCIFSGMYSVETHGFSWGHFSIGSYICFFLRILYFWHAIMFLLRPNLNTQATCQCYRVHTYAHFCSLLSILSSAYWEDFSPPLRQSAVKQQSIPNPHQQTCCYIQRKRKK